MYLERTAVAALMSVAAIVATWAVAVEPSAAVPPAVEAYATQIGNIEGIKVFEGDFTDDGAEDALAFIYYSETGGNAVYLDVSLFESVNGKLVHKAVVKDVFGSSPRNVSISHGRIEVTTTVLKEGEPRCCPTGEAHYTIKP